MNRLNLALAAAICLAGFPLVLLTDDRMILVWLAIMLLASVGIGAAARALRTPDGIARALQLLPGAAAVWWLWEEWPDIISETAEYVAAAYAPMPPHEGFRVLTVAVLWFLFVAAEAVASGLDRPGWTFPLLVLPYLVPSIVLSDETSPLYLVPVAVGYLLVLATAVYGRAARQLPARRGRLAIGIGASAAVVGVAAWTLSGLAAAALPERGTAVVDPGPLDTSVQLGDPTLDLVRNLRTPTPRRILEYTSSDGRGHYLRLAALSAFDANGFHLVPTDLLPGMPERPAAANPEPVTLEVKVANFASEWLPVPWMPQRIEASGDWRHDPVTGAIVAIGANRTRATANLEYRVEARLLEPGQPEIAAADPGDPRDGGITLALPEDLDPRIPELARQLTSDADTAGERALILGHWLRSEEFTYSTAAVEGSTLGTLSDFLLVSRTGYCEQFAGALAVLARAVGIPSRMAVGFMPGSKTDQGYEVTTKNMHTWTEVLLDGLGWVAIDPTPSGAPGAAPIPSASPTSSPPTPSTQPSEEEPPTPPEGPNLPEDPVPTVGSGFRLPGWTGWVIGALVVAALPAAVRQLRNRHRLRSGRDPVTAAEDAWEELRDTVLDLGRPWPSGTPRQVVAALVTDFGRTVAEPLGELASQVERARFAPTVEDPIDPRLLRRVAAALTSAVPIRPRLGRLLPRSVFRLHA
ncbi:MAG: DUF3488 and transglutaminase-like domain-containing protein [Actinobacteria bacterium]|nr:DUF3488 and transglutaminase-like domain-containing protein [Actinomycetota bacterium]